MPHPFVLCDVFAPAPLGGNQLAVFTEAQRIPEAALVRLARELNFSETSFLYPPAADGDVRLRIFSPLREWPFAGHPILGAAAVAGRLLARDRLRVETGVGTLELTLLAKGGAVRAALRAPVPRATAFAEAAALRRALGLAVDDAPVPQEDAGMPHAYVELPSAAAVAAVVPDHAALRPLTVEVGANCFALDGRHARLRMFAPGDGVEEDAATGSAAVGLAAHLARSGRLAPGVELVVEQGAEIGRPSILRARALAAADGELAAIEVAGDVRMVAEGAFYDEATTATVASVGSPQ